MRALELGAVDFVTKPKLEASATRDDYGAQIADKIRARPRARALKVPRVRQPERHRCTLPAPMRASAPVPTDEDSIASSRGRLHRRHRGDPRIPDAACRPTAPAS